MSAFLYRCLPVACILSVISVDAGAFPNPLTSAFSAADPGIKREGSPGLFYVYSTSGSSTGAMPIRWSTDRVNWTDSGARVFPNERPDLWPPWREPGSGYWAPEVYYIGGQYVCYYSCQAASDGWFKIGVATSSSPAGPFKDKGTPMVSWSQWSLIDPSFFRDTDGRQYLLWKDNTNALDPKQDTNLVINEVSADGLTRVGSSQRLLHNTLSWEGDCTEAPSLVKRGSYYYLFYSANNYGTDRYAVGVARSTNIKGPYTKKGNPILKSDSKFDGPGGQCPRQDADGTWRLYYHARLRSNPAAGRVLMMDTINWGSDGWPTIHDGTPSE